MSHGSNRENPVLIARSSSEARLAAADSRRAFEFGGGKKLRASLFLRRCARPERERVWLLKSERGDGHELIKGYKRDERERWEIMKCIIKCSLRSYCLGYENSYFVDKGLGKKCLVALHIVYFVSSLMRTF